MKNPARSQSEKSEVNDSAVSGNSVVAAAAAISHAGSAYGGGIFNHSTLTLNSSTVSHNTTTITGVDGGVRRGEWRRRAIQ